MASYKIINTEGVDQGTYDAESAVEALAAAYRDAGYDVQAEEGELFFVKEEEKYVHDGVDALSIAPAK